MIKRKDVRKGVGYGAATTTAGKKSDDSAVVANANTNSPRHSAGASPFRESHNNYYRKEQHPRKQQRRCSVTVVMGLLFLGLYALYVLQEDYSNTASIYWVDYENISNEKSSATTAVESIYDSAKSLYNYGTTTTTTSSSPDEDKNIQYNHETTDFIVPETDSSHYTKPFWIPEQQQQSIAGAKDYDDDDFEDNDDVDAEDGNGEENRYVTDFVFPDTATYHWVDGEDDTIEEDIVDDDNAQESKYEENPNTVSINGLSSDETNSKIEVPDEDDETGNGKEDDIDDNNDDDEDDDNAEDDDVAGDEDGDDDNAEDDDVDEDDESENTYEKLESSKRLRDDNKTNVKTKTETQTTAEVETEARMNVEKEAKAKVDTKAEAVKEAETKVKAEKEAKEKAKVNTKANIQKGTETKAEADTKVKDDKGVKAIIEKGAKEKTEAGTKANISKGADTKAKDDKEAKAKAEIEKATKADVKAKMEEVANAKGEAIVEAIAKAKKEAKPNDQTKTNKDGSKSIPPSKMKIHYYEIWDHKTSTIQIPEKYKNPFDEWLMTTTNSSEKRRRPRTSLEILQEVLHGNQYKSDFEALQDYLNYTQWEELAKNEKGKKPTIQKVDPPRCLVADVESTRALADKVVAERKLAQNRRKLGNVKVADWPFEKLSLGIPILNVGYPKVGSNTIKEYLECIGLRANHGQQGARMFSNIENGTEIFKSNHNTTHPPYTAHAYTQLDFNTNTGFYPQISLLDEIHEASPKSTMVFLFRPVMDWIASTKKWNQMYNRFGKFIMPGLQLTAEQLDRNTQIAAEMKKNGNTTLKHIRLTNLQVAKWWCGHVLHIREYTKEYPSHALIELDLYDSDGSSSLLHDLFEVDTDAYFQSNPDDAPKEKPAQCWGHSNKGEDRIAKSTAKNNAKEKQAIDKDRRQRTRMARRQIKGMTSKKGKSARARSRN